MQLLFAALLTQDLVAGAPPLVDPPAPKVKDGHVASGGPLLPEQAAYDVCKYALALRVRPEEKAIDGTLTITAKATMQQPLGQLLLDLDGALHVTECSSAGQPLGFRQAGGMVSIALDRWYTAGEEFTVAVSYGGEPRVAPNAPWDGGFTWGSTADGRPWIATTCQMDGADLWWPCKDHPSDKADHFDLRATVPTGLVCASNGKLVESVVNGDATTTFHWRLDTPVSNYCIALNIAPYELIRDEATSVTGEKIPVWFYVLPEHFEQGKKALPAFLRDLHVFEELCGPYPFRAEKYGIAETPHLGMEHATITAYGNRFRADPDGYDWLHNHEFSHEWWANLVTCRDWKDMWIHEGIGTYMQPLFLERTRGRDAYFAEMKKDRRGIANRMAVAPREIQDSKEIYKGDIYNKGAWFMHTLRWLVGDKLFFQALRRMAYPDPATEMVTDGSQIRFSDTEEIRAIAEEVTGRELGWLFEVYLRQPDLPRLVTTTTTTTNTTATAGTVGELTLEWKVPAGLEFPMPVPVRLGSVTQRIEMPDGRAVVPLPVGATAEVDPEGWILKALK